MGSCVLRETIRKGRPRFAPRVSLSIYLSPEGIYWVTPKSTIDSGERVPPGSAARDVGQLVDRCKLHYCTAAASSAHDSGTQRGA